MSQKKGEGTVCLGRGNCTCKEEGRQWLLRGWNVTDIWFALTAGWALMLTPLSRRPASGGGSHWANITQTDTQLQTALTAPNERIGAIT